MVISYNWSHLVGRILPLFFRTGQQRAHKELRFPILLMRTFAKFTLGSKPDLNLMKIPITLNIKRKSLNRNVFQFYHIFFYSVCPLKFVISNILGYYCIILFSSYPKITFSNLHINLY